MMGSAIGGVPGWSPWSLEDCLQIGFSRSFERTTATLENVNSFALVYSRGLRIRLSKDIEED